MAPKRAGSSGSLASTPDAKRRRPMTLQERAEKALYDSCRGMSQEQKLVVRANGKNLLEVVMDELSKMDVGSGNKIGANRWKELKAPFLKASAKPAAEALEVPLDAVENVPAGLVKGVISAKKNHPDRGPLINFLPTSPELNRTGICGLWKLALTLNPKCHKQMPLCQSIVKHMHAQQLDTKWQEEFACMNDWVVGVLTVAFHKSGLEPMEFSKLWGNVLKLVFPGVAYDKVNAAGGKYAEAPEAMEELVVSSKLGMELYAHAMISSVEVKVFEAIQQVLDPMFHAEGKWDRSRLDAIKTELEDKVDSVPAVALLPPRRTVRVQFRGKIFHRKVQSNSGLIAISVAAAWKGRAVAEGLLKPTWAEKMLIGSYTGPKVAKKLDESLAQAALMARERGDKDFALAEGVTGPLMLDKLKSSIQSCQSIDVEFDLEAMLIDNVCGEAAEILLAELCIDPLPTATNAVTVEAAVQQIAKVAHGSLYKLAPLAARTKVDLVLKWLGLLLEFREPEYSEAKGCKTMQKVADRLAFFIRFEKAAGSAKKEEVVCGAAALPLIYAKAQKDHEKSKLTLDQCWQLQAFRMLLPSEIRDPVGVMLKDLQKSNIKSAKSSSSSSSKGGKPKDSAVSQAMAIFLAQS